MNTTVSRVVMPYTFGKRKLLEGTYCLRFHGQKVNPETRKKALVNLCRGLLNDFWLSLLFDPED
jgi:hypothetical protein